LFNCGRRVGYLSAEGGENQIPLLAGDLVKKVYCFLFYLRP